MLGYDCNPMVENANHLFFYFLSILQVSRAQHQQIKNIKHSADGIQPKLLGRVLGDIQCFHVHPYETFEEEEKKRLHEHWLVFISLMVSLMSESY